MPGRQSRHTPFDSAANVHDVKQVPEVLDGIVIEGPEWTGIPWENLWADQEYFGEPALETIVLRRYIPQVVPRGEGGRTPTIETRQREAGTAVGC
ncbi:MAG: hypothetical protein LBT14_02735 [Treponema sp.]|jgi:hypothetical protein|nr:hypothetical protein [Treponema sp.]